MPERTSALGLIPARGGSKGIPGKNLHPLAGKPLIAYTCEAALASRRLTRVILSSDSPEIIAAAREYGVEAPFVRPVELAQDDTPTLPVLRHALEWLAEHDGFRPDIVVILQPTAPLRTAQHVDEAVDLLIASRADSVVSVSPVPGHYNPQWQFVIEGGELRTYTGEPIGAIPVRRQSLPSTYTRNGALYACWRVALEDTGTVYGARVVPYVMPTEFSPNIDGPMDLLLAEALLQQRKDVS